MDAVAKKEGHICHMGLIGICGWCSHGSHPKEKILSHSMHGTGALQETNISPQKWHFASMIFLFPFGGICDRSLEIYYLPTIWLFFSCWVFMDR